VSRESWKFPEKKKNVVLNRQIFRFPGAREKRPSTGPFFHRREKKGKKKREERELTSNVRRIHLKYSSGGKDGKKMEKNACSPLKRGGIPPASRWKEGEKKGGRKNRLSLCSTVPTGVVERGKRRGKGNPRQIVSCSVSERVKKRGKNRRLRRCTLNFEEGEGELTWNPPRRKIWLCFNRCARKKKKRKGKESRPIFFRTRWRKDTEAKASPN